MWQNKWLCMCIQNIISALLIMHATALSCLKCKSICNTWDRCSSKAAVKPTEATELLHAAPKAAAAAAEHTNISEEKGYSLSINLCTCPSPCSVDNFSCLCLLHCAFVCASSAFDIWMPGKMTTTTTRIVRPSDKSHCTPISFAR